MHRLDTDLSQSLSHPTSIESRVAALEAQLARAHEHIAELEARDSLKTQFLANISHDLRTPLTAVITHAEILRDGILGPLTPRQQGTVRLLRTPQPETMEWIITGGPQLLAQVSEIVPYARGAANQLTVT